MPKDSKTFANWQFTFKSAILKARVDYICRQEGYKAMSLKGYNQNKRLLGLQDSALERLQKTMSMGFGQNRIREIITRQDATANLLKSFQSPLFDDFERTVNHTALLEQRDILESAGLITNAVSELEQTVKALRGYDFPKPYDVSTYLGLVEQSQFFKDISAQQLETVAVARSIADMNVPWSHISDAGRSIQAFKTLHNFGTVFDNGLAFESRVTKAVRESLGDWRGSLALPASILGNPVARDEFYVEQGFDEQLADFPDEAFDEVLIRTGLRDADYKHPANDAEDEDNDEVERVLFRRLSEGQSIITRLEYKTRKFINYVMTEKYGENWPKHKAGQHLYQEWTFKRESSLKKGHAAKPLIYYADMTDYERVICKKDNWKEVFEAYFHRLSNVQEAFNRIGPARVELMHIRGLTRTDILYLQIEASRFIDTMNEVLQAI